MSQNRKAFIATQSLFYRNNFRRLINVTFFLIAISYILIGTIVYLHLSKPDPQYFVTTSDGRLIEIQPLSSN